MEFREVKCPNGIAFLTGLIILGIAVPVQTQQFQGATATVEPPCMPIFAKVTQTPGNDGKIHISWCTAGRHLLPAGERGTDGKSVRYTYLGCYAAFDPRDGGVTQADGKPLKVDEARKRLAVGTVVLVSMDTQAISRDFLARIKGDTPVIRIDSISLTESAGDE
jgi:hypothetical protein